MRAGLDWSFRARILVGFGALFGLVATAQALVLLARFDTVAHRTELKRVEGLTTVIAAASGPALDFDDAELLAERLGLLGTDDEAVGATVHGPDGDLRGRWGPRPPGGPVPTTAGVDVEPGALVVRTPIPTRSGRDGWLQVRYDHHEHDRIEAENHRMILGLTLLSFLGSLLLGSMLAAWLVRPMRALADQARAVSRGTADLSVLTTRTSTRPFRHDEARMLQAAFAHMAGVVQGQLDALDHARATAESAHAQAVEASLAKSRFLANMSHELRTPLNGIVGYAEMLVDDLDELPPDEVRADLVRIQRASRHLLSLISDILDLSKIEAGQMTIYPEPVRLDDLLDAIADAVGPLAQQRGNILRMRRHPDAPATLYTDLTKLKQCLLNLVANAAKFTTDGQVEVVVASRGRDTVCFEVTDTGIGMTTEQLARVFEEFTQADESTTRRFGGTGLGLTLVRHLVDLLGGSLKVRSQAGVGTTFLVFLPLALPGREDHSGRQLRPSSPSRRRVSSTSDSTEVEVTTLE